MRAPLAARLSLLPVIGLVACLAGAPASAETMEDIYHKCVQPDLTRLDAVIGFCTKVIKSGQGGNGAQAGAHLSRGNMYRRKAQYDRALADYNQSLRLDPKDPAPTLTSRGNALCAWDTEYVDLATVIRK